MLNRSQITAVHWQMDATANAAPEGAIVTDMRDLDQAIRLALLTEQGSVPLAPEKGLDLASYRDRPSAARHLFLGAAVRTCLDRDVPRVVIENVTAALNGFSSVLITIVWRPRADVAADFQTTEVALDV